VSVQVIQKILTDQKHLLGAVGKALEGVAIEQSPPKGEKQDCSGFQAMEDEDWAGEEPLKHLSGEEPPSDTEERFHSSEGGSPGNSEAIHISRSETIEVAVKIDPTHSNPGSQNPPLSLGSSALVLNEDSGSLSGVCPICLQPVDGEAYVDPCFHRFCFSCILQWSEMGAVRTGDPPLCPVCKGPFLTIIHDFRGTQFKRYDVLGGKSSSPFQLSEKHVLRRAVYTDGGETSDTSGGFGRGQGRWLRCWVRRDLQALLEEEDVEMVALHIVGSVELLAEQRRQKQKFGRNARPLLSSDGGEPEGLVTSLKRPPRKEKALVFGKTSLVLSKAGLARRKARKGINGAVRSTVPVKRKVKGGMGVLKEEREREKRESSARKVMRWLEKGGGHQGPEETHGGPEIAQGILEGASEALEKERGLVAGVETQSFLGSQEGLEAALITQAGLGMQESLETQGGLEVGPRRGQVSDGVSEAGQGRGVSTSEAGIDGQIAEPSFLTSEADRQSMGEAQVEGESEQMSAGDQVKRGEGTPGSEKEGHNSVEGGEEGETIGAGGAKEGRKDIGLVSVAVEAPTEQEEVETDGSPLEKAQNKRETAVSETEAGRVFTPAEEAVQEQGQKCKQSPEDKEWLQVVASAAQPFIFEYAGKFAAELMAFLKSGLDIASYDAATLPLPPGGSPVADSPTAQNDAGLARKRSNGSPLEDIALLKRAIEEENEGDYYVEAGTGGGRPRKKRREKAEVEYGSLWTAAKEDLGALPRAETEGVMGGNAGQERNEKRRKKRKGGEGEEEERRKKHRHSEKVRTGTG
jgi:hypothetical protein